MTMDKLFDGSNAHELCGTEWVRGGKQHVLKTYEKLHEGKIGAHWLWVAIERIANGEPEIEVMRDYEYVYSPKEKP